MQNPYAIERFIQEHNSHAWATAELQALRRKAATERRHGLWETWRNRLSRVSWRPVGTRFAREGR